MQLWVVITAELHLLLTERKVGTLMSSRPTVFCMVHDQIFMEMSWRPDAAGSDSGVPPLQSHSLFGWVKVEVMICPLTPDLFCLPSGTPLLTTGAWSVGCPPT